MKSPAFAAGFGLSLLLCFILLYGCTKRDLLPLSPPPLSIKVAGTSPQNDQRNGFYDGNVTATFDAIPDTGHFSIAVTVLQGDTVLAGTVQIEDSLVTFIPDTELLPTHFYTAIVTLTEKGMDSPAYRYQWQFATKERDEYSMTQRSNRVTDGNRDGNRCAQIGDYLYSFGGWKDPPVASYNDVYRSSGDLSVWEKRPNAPWHGRHVYGMGKIGNWTYVVGGDPLQPEFDVWRTADGENWTRLAQNLLGNRVLYGCTVHNGFIYVVGGAGHNDVWRSRNGINWELIGDNIPFLNGENFAGSLESFHGKLWMVCGGGDGWGGGLPRNEVWSSTDGAFWKREKDFAGTSRYYTDVCVWDNKLWVVGGYNYIEGNVKSIWYMKPDGSWKEFKTPDNYIARHATGVAVYKNSLAIVCGNYGNDCWVIEKVK
ncbi:MAG TPA: hypothetical protein VM871_07970 [Flavisolibacter sp.]|jgi:hypothetical protein|nr:hypothetical protein [Flavisolibacter sp.]